MKGLSIVIAVVSVASVFCQDDSDCMPKSGERPVHAGQCCNVRGMMPEKLKDGWMKCADKYPRPPRPTGPPPSGPPPPPTPEMKNNMSCMAECVFNASGLITDGALNKDAVMKAFTVNETVLSAVLDDAKKKCFDSYKKDIDTSRKCTSGAHEFKTCMERTVFKNCPASAWTSSSECEALKAKVDKCPQMPIMMGRRPHHHRQ